VSIVIYFFRGGGPPPCSPGWPAAPCTCNGLWLLSRMAVSLKENNCFFVTDQTPCPIVIYLNPYHSKPWPNSIARPVCTYLYALMRRRYKD
jgi:hypothetical protein